MSNDPEILSAIYDVTRGDLERSAFPFPNAGALVSSMIGVRVKSISRPFQKGQDNAQKFFLQSTEDLLTGMAGQGIPCLYALRGVPGDLQCWYGIPSQYGNHIGLKSLLTSAYGGGEFDSCEPMKEAWFGNFPEAAILTGVPSRKNGENGTSIAKQIEKLCQGLSTTSWAYAVYAEPVNPTETLTWGNNVARTIRDVASKFLLKGSPADQENRLVQRYIELLEKKQQRLEKGRVAGMWATHAMLFAESQTVLSRGMALAYSAFAGPDSMPEPLRVLRCTRGASEGPVLEPLNSAELAILLRPPAEEYAGFDIADLVQFGVQKSAMFMAQSSVAVGIIVDRNVETSNTLEIPLDEFAKHTLVAGVTGSGKTNTCFRMIEKIWDKGKGLPFLVIEPAKSEYRNLLDRPGFQDLLVFSVGDERIAPLRLNPLAVPKGALIQSHIDYVRALFAAAFVLYPPMPYVLERSLQEAYTDRGWDLASNENGLGGELGRSFPTLGDLGAKVAEIVDSMGYSTEISMNVKAGLLARIRQLCGSSGKGRMLNTRESTPLEVLFGSPCVIELKQIASDDEKAFVIGLLLMLLYEFMETREGTHGRLHHITLIEEAHRLLRNVATEQGSEVHANPRGMAVEVFTNMLAEIRGYGEGVIIAEQIPTKLAPDVLKNTGLKIIHRLVAEDDRARVGGSMNLNEVQIQHLAKLRGGLAVVYSEVLSKPTLVQIPLFDSKARAENVSIAAVRSRMARFWSRHLQLTRSFQGCAACKATEQQQAACRIPTEAGESDGAWSLFTRYFNAIRLNKAVAWTAFADFHDYCRRNRRPVYCTLAGMVEREVDRRARLYQWRHAEAERVIALACEIGLEFSNRERTKQSVEPIAWKKMSELGFMIERLCTADILPFVGCESCSRHCAYRYDVIRGNDNREVEKYQTFLKAGDFGLAVRESLNMMKRNFAEGDLRSVEGAALCFAIQQSAYLEYPRVQQTKIAEETVWFCQNISRRTNDETV